MNTQLLLQIADRIAKRPEQFLMHCWIANSECGTAACICGWAVLLSGKKMSCFVDVEGADLLGIERANFFTSTEASRLFNRSNWPQQFRVDALEGSPEFAEAAVRRIHWFIQTEGRE